MSEIVNLDIVKLIEKSPITRLTHNYQNKFIEKLKESFNDNEQHLFISNFYCYINYNSKTDYIINFDDVWKWLGYTRKDSAKKLLEKNFIKDIDYKEFIGKNDDIFPPQFGGGKNDETRGGSNKEKLILNINTFKKLCLKANTEKADKIHDYYIKLEELLQEVINEESNELKLQIENKNEEIKNNQQQIQLRINQLESQKDAYSKLQKEKDLERHNILLKEYAKLGPLVYIIKVKTYNDNKYIIKIGESRYGILQRYQDHNRNYEECIILDCFLVQNSKKFESFLHNHKDINPHKIKNLENHETEKELFLINQELPYEHLKRIINNNIRYYNDVDKELELKNLEIKLAEKDETINLNIIKNLELKIEELELKLLEKNTINNRDIQKIQFENKKLKMYIEELQIKYNLPSQEEPLNEIYKYIQTLFQQRELFSENTQEFPENPQEIIQKDTKEFKKEDTKEIQKDTREKEIIKENTPEIIPEQKEIIQENPKEENPKKEKIIKPVNDKYKVDEDDYFKFLDNTIEYSKDKCVLKSVDLVFLYKNDYKISKSNMPILTEYKKLLEKYIKKKYPNVRADQHTINIGKTREKGWNNLYIKKEFKENLKQLLENNEKWNKEVELNRIKEHDALPFEKDENLWEFFEKNIEYTSEKIPLQIIEIAEKYENRKIDKKTIVCIEHDYKFQFEKYIRLNYPDVKFFNEHVSIDKKKTNGWYYFKLK